MKLAQSLFIFSPSQSLIFDYKQINIQSDVTESDIHFVYTKHYKR